MSLAPQRQQQSTSAARRVSTLAFEFSARRSTWSESSDDSGILRVRAHLARRESAPYHQRHSISGQSGVHAWLASYSRAVLVVSDRRLLGAYREVRTHFAPGMRVPLTPSRISFAALVAVRT